MKILESQNAILTNYEVLHFLSARAERKPREKGRRRPGGQLDTLVQEVVQYLSAPPAPLSQQPSQYSAATVARVVERLRSFDLAKGELVMIINMRPQTPAQLHACVEEVESRLSEDQQSALLDIVADVLGQFPVAEEEEEG